MTVRPVAQSVSITTSTGNFGPAYFGTLMSRAAVEISNTGSTQAIKGTVQGSMGASGVWSDVITLTSGGTTGSVSLAANSTALFDKLRISLSANELSSTGTSGLTAWLGAALSLSTAVEFYDFKRQGNFRWYPLLSNHERDHRNRHALFQTRSGVAKNLGGRQLRGGLFYQPE